MNFAKFIKASLKPRNLNIGGSWFFIDLIDLFRNKKISNSDLYIYGDRDGDIVHQAIATHVSTM